MNRFLLFFLIIFFLIDIFLNPGIIEKEKFSEKRIKDEYKDLSRFKNCKNCNIYVPKYLKPNHCEFCGICIENKNHHDFIIGKCVGKNTCLIHFLCLILFIFYLLRTCFLLLFILTDMFYFLFY